MAKLYWQGQALALNLKAHDEDYWVSLPDILEAVGGHVKNLPKGALGFCLADDRCLPLGAADTFEAGGITWLRVRALSPLGLQSDSDTPADLPVLGDPMPNLSLPDLQGQPFALSSLQGKPSLIFAWASW